MINVDPIVLDIGLLVLVGGMLAERIYHWVKGKAALAKMQADCAVLPAIKECLDQIEADSKLAMARLDKIKTKVDRLAEQHNYPNQHGLGTETTNRLLEELLRNAVDAADRQGQLFDLIKEFIYEMRSERERNGGRGTPG